MSRTDDPFSSVAAHLLQRPGVTRSTMMGYPCLRLDGDFFASWDAAARRIVVKLDAATVASMIADGTGEPFEPNGRRFREWIAVPSDDDSVGAVLDDAFECAVRRRPAPSPRRRTPRGTRSDP